MKPGATLLRRAEQTPTAAALETPERSWSFAELAERARRGAGHLLATAPSGGAPIALLMPGDAQFVAWFHAIALAGRTVLPLNGRLTPAELAQQVSDARVDLLLGVDGDDRLAKLASQVAGLTAKQAPFLDALPAPSGLLPGAEADAEAVLAVLFTSGTTGRAKGACLSWGNFLASAHAAADRLGPVVGERWLACMPLFHVGGLSILIRSALFGGAVRLLPRFDAPVVSDALDAGDIAGISLVPTMLSRLLTHRAGRPAPVGLCAVLLGGAAAAPELLLRAMDAGFPVCPTYGLTEATSQVATARPPRAGAKRVPPMRPLPGVEVRIVVGGHEVAIGAPGEIVVRGPGVMRGYLHDPDATARTLRDGWLSTGDIGYVDPDGGLHVLDRRDDLIVSGGENVYPAEIEAILLEHPAVADVGVAGVHDDDLGTRVVAWVVPVAGAAPDPVSLQMHCRDRLAGFKQPREFRYTAVLPRTASGKLLRRRLAETDSSS